jgi:hypothetical protein
MRKHGSIVRKLCPCLPNGPINSAHMGTIVTTALQQQYLQTELILWICLLLPYIISGSKINGSSVTPTSQVCMFSIRSKKIKKYDEVSSVGIMFTLNFVKFSQLMQNLKYIKDTQHCNIISLQFNFFKNWCGNFPEQWINTGSVAAKLTHVPTATDKQRVRCYTRSTATNRHRIK